VSRKALMLVKRFRSKALLACSLALVGSAVLGACKGDSARTPLATPTQRQATTAQPTVKALTTPTPLLPWTLPPPGAGSSVGKVAPDLTLATLDGGFRLSEQRGKVVLLYFSFPG
jgi:hypothetical protein